MKKAFTLTELLVAIAVMAIAMSGVSLIFKVSVDSQRMAKATSEIMRNLRAITDQLNTDFKELQSDGFLILCSEKLDFRKEFNNSDPSKSDPNDFRSDRLYYFCTGDFQSWFETNLRSNIARVYLGHDSDVIYDGNIPASEWELGRDLILLTAANSVGFPSWPADCNHVSFAECKADILAWFENPNDILDFNMPAIDIHNPNSIRSLMCQNVGSLRIEWTDETMYPSGGIAWFGFDLTKQIGDGNIPPDPNYAAATGEAIITAPVDQYWIFFNPSNQPYWPRALKFTFTLYDSKGILKEGKTFTHIVYIGS